MTRSELLRRKEQLEKDIAKYSNMQLAKKVQLNSAYGALGNQWFRFYDIRQATAITKSGQLSIKWIEARINEYLNELLETNGEDYVLASDTDSLYIVLTNWLARCESKENFWKRVRIVYQPNEWLDSWTESLEKRLNRLSIRVIKILLKL